MIIKNLTLMFFCVTKMWAMSPDEIESNRFYEVVIREKPLWRLEYQSIEKMLSRVNTYPNYDMWNAAYALSLPQLDAAGLLEKNAEGEMACAVEYSRGLDCAADIWPIIKGFEISEKTYLIERKSGIEDTYSICGTWEMESLTVRKTMYTNGRHIFYPLVLRINKKTSFRGDAFHKGVFAISGPMFCCRVEHIGTFEWEDDYWNDTENTSDRGLDDADVPGDCEEDRGDVGS